MEGVADYYADQFPAREWWRNIHTAFSHLLCLRESNGVIIGSDRTLVKRFSYTDDDYRTAEQNLRAVADFQAACEKESLPCTVCVAPRTIDVAFSSLPAPWDNSREMAVNQDIADAIPSAVMTYSLLKDLYDAGEYVTYRTDHHWTTRGAYEIYRELAPSLGYTPMPEDHYRQEIVTDAFLGTTAAASGLSPSYLSSCADSVALWRWEGDEEVSVVNRTTNTTSSLYHTEYLEGHDKYSVFLGGNAALLSIEDDDAEKPTLLVIKDSFANSLLPFLAEHFHLLVVDLRYYDKSLAKLMETEQIDGVLVLCGADTFVTDPSLAKISYGFSSD